MSTKARIIEKLDGGAQMVVAITTTGARGALTPSSRPEVFGFTIVAAMRVPDLASIPFPIASVKHQQVITARPTLVPSS